MAENQRWPGLDASTAAVFEQVGRGITPNNLDNFTVRRATFFHRQAYAAAGQAQLTFFNSAPAKYRSNWAGAGGLEVNKGMWLSAVRIFPETGITLAGARAANGAQLASTAKPIAEVGEELRSLFQLGHVQLKVGDRNYVDAFGLNRFPAGFGMTADVAAEDTNTTVVHQGAVLNNGAPFSGNGYFLTPMVPILPQKPVALTVDWVTVLTVTTLFVLRVELDGIIVHPSNL